MIVTYDVRRGGYHYFAPGYYDLRGTDARGADEPAAIELTGTCDVNWTMPITRQRIRTIHIVGDRLKETLTYIPNHQVIYRTALTRSSGKVVWGEPAP